LRNDCEWPVPVAQLNGPSSRVVTEACWHARVGGRYRVADNHDHDKEYACTPMSPLDPSCPVGEGLFLTRPWRTVEMFAGIRRMQEGEAWTNCAGEAYSIAKSVPAYSVRIFHLQLVNCPDFPGHHALVFFRRVRVVDGPPRSSSALKPDGSGTAQEKTHFG
jgi:hypothetical protein